MADRISAAHRQAPSDLFVVLVGNLHTRVEGTTPYIPMGVLLGQREPAMSRRALNVAYSGGTAWDLHRRGAGKLSGARANGTAD